MNCVPSSCMSWYLVSAILVVLWKYDKCLLDKLQLWMWNSTKSSMWYILKLYSEYKDRNEMIKDGYHVDSVYLYEHHSSTYSRKLDVLRIFREQIVNETFTNKKSIDFDRFLALCSDPDSNFQVNKDLKYDLEVNYTLDRRQYKIVYSNDENSRIRFPVYSEKEVMDGVQNSIISAMIVRNANDVDGIDIGDVLLKYAGPLGNFYNGTDFCVKKSWLSFAGIEDNVIIKMMDINGDEYIFRENDKYLSLK